MDLHICISGDTLMRDNCKLIGMPHTRSAGSEKSRLIGSTRTYSVDIIPAKEQHKYRCLRWFLSLSRDADVHEGQPGAIHI